MWTSTAAASALQMFWSLDSMELLSWEWINRPRHIEHLALVPQNHLLSEHYLIAFVFPSLDCPVCVCPTVPVAKFETRHLKSPCITGIDHDHFAEKKKKQTNKNYNCQTCKLSQALQSLERIWSSTNLEESCLVCQDSLKNLSERSLWFGKAAYHIWKNI